MTCTAAWNQKAFRGRNDDGNETAATWKAAQSINFSQLKDTNFRIRFEVQETAACAGNNKVWQLQYNKNGAGWVTVDGASSNVRSSASPNLADAANLTDQLTAGTGTFQGATGFDEANGAAGGNSMDVAASGHAEAEFCVQIRSADVASGDTIQLRITDNGTAFAAYDATPTVTVSSGNVTATPSTLALVASRFAPTVLTPRVVTPSTLALALAGFAPTVQLGIKATPTTLGLILSTFAPTVLTPRTVTPGVVALTLATFAPTVQTPRLAVPPPATLALSTFAPTLILPVVVTPSTLALVATGFAPSISTPRLVTPTPLALALSTFAPTVTAGGGGGPSSVTPGTLALVLVTYAPTVTVTTNPAPARPGHGGAIRDWRRWMAKLEEEEDERKKRKEKDLRELLRMRRDEWVRAEAEEAGLVACLAAALDGDDDWRTG